MIIEMSFLYHLLILQKGGCMRRHFFILVHYAVLCETNFLKCVYSKFYYICDHTNSGHYEFDKKENNYCYIRTFSTISLTENKLRSLKGIPLQSFPSANTECRDCLGNEQTKLFSTVLPSVFINRTIFMLAILVVWNNQSKQQEHHPSHFSILNFCCTYLAFMQTLAQNKRSITRQRLHWVKKNSPASVERKIHQTRFYKVGQKCCAFSFSPHMFCVQPLHSANNQRTYFTTEHIMSPFMLTCIFFFSVE